MTALPLRNQTRESEVEYEFIDEFDEMLEWEDEAEQPAELSTLAHRAYQHRFD